MGKPSIVWSLLIWLCFFPTLQAMLRTTAVLQEVYKEGSWQLLLEAFTERWLWMILAGLWRRSTKSGCASGKSWGWKAWKVSTCSLVAALFLFSPSLCGFQPCGFEMIWIRFEAKDDELLQALKEHGASEQAGPIGLHCCRRSDCPDWRG